MLPSPSGQFNGMLAAADRFRDRAPWWGGDLQTLRNFFLAWPRPLSSHATTVAFLASDGSGDRLSGKLERSLRPAEASPLVVLVHGLTGCEDSTYVRETARFHLVRGRAVLRLNLRGAGPSRAIAQGYYHAGCFGDLRDVIVGLDPADTRHGVFVVGYSLGGNILLNLLGGAETPSGLIGAATVSAPIIPIEASRRIMAARNSVYHRFLLRRMKRDVLSSAELSDDERRVIRQARTVYEFDDCWVAPRNGFRDAADYYARTAGAQFVPRISIPTLMLHARNDPWIPVQPYLDLLSRAAPAVAIVVARSGGHVGFHEHGHRETWHDRMIDAFIREVCGS